MAATAQDIVERSSTVRELEAIGATWLKRGHEARVSLKDAGYGVAVDVREHITADAYRAEDHRVMNRGRKGGKAREPYVGPTKKGLWLSPEQALELGELLVAAGLRALEVSADD